MKFHINDDIMVSKESLEQEITKEKLLSPLNNIFFALNINLDEIKKKESSDRVSCEVTFLPKQINNLKLEHLNLIFQVWGKYISFRITCDEIPYNLESNSYEKIFEDLIDDIKKIDQKVICSLGITIDKKSYVRKKFSGNQNIRVILYLYEYGIINLLQSNFKTIEEALFQNRNVKSIIIILEKDICMSGDYIAFIGGNCIEKYYKKVLPNEPPDFNIINDIIKIREDTTKWIKIDTNLTPFHFFGEYFFEDSDLNKIIKNIFINFIILYLADKSKKTNKYITSTFIGTGQVNVETLKNILNIDDNTLKCFKDLFIWAYKENTLDKSLFIRNIISLNLSQENEKNYKILIEKIAHINNAILSNYKIYISNTIDKYFKIRKEAIDYSQSLSDHFNSQISEIINSVVKIMRDSVVAAVGTLLPYVIKPELSPFLFNVGLKVYALYVLLFPCIYTMSHNYLQFQSIIEDFEKRKIHFSEFMEEGNINDILISPIEKRKKQFKRWFFITLCLYILIVIFIFIISTIDLKRRIGVIPEIVS